MPDFVELKLAERVGTKYYNFGILLLDDKDGNRTNAIIKEKRENAEEINTEILHKWLQGNGKDSVSWATLVEVLDKIGLKKLAKHVKVGIV